MNQTRLLQFFEQRCVRGESLVLGTVIRTTGSTYSKTGDQMLIDERGVACGMLSGGCLESDLAARAQVVLESGKPQTASYELAAGDDDVWGLGIGCDGSMSIYLQALTPRNDYQPYAGIASVLRGNDAATITIDAPADDVNLSFVVRPPTRLLVLGAGPDAVPLAKIAVGLGWRCTVIDHRPAYVENNAFPDACARHCAAAEKVPETVLVDDFDAAVVMSHHLASDRTYLGKLADSSISYIGLLGPQARKERLLGELGDAASKLSARLHGPAGLDLGGRGPEIIALSIVAEIQQVLGKA